MANGENAHKTMPLVELVDDPVRPDAKRSESTETTPSCENVGMLAGYAAIAMVLGALILARRDA